MPDKLCLLSGMAGTSPAMTEKEAQAMTAFILPLSDTAATEPDCVGPKAANLAALQRAGLPTPGGFALTAEAYRHQLRHLGVEALVRQFNEADLPDVAQIVGADPACALSGADRAEDCGAFAGCVARAARRWLAGRGAFLGADRGPQGSKFRRAVRKLPWACR